MKSILIIADAYLGRCPHCMKIAFRAFLIALLLAIWVLFAIPSKPILIALLVMAGSFALLWIAHLTAFGIRTVTTKSNKQTDAQSNERRRAMGLFVKAIAFAAAATAVPRLSSAADCNCAPPLKCCWNFRASDFVCAPSDANCCAGNNPWYCPKGQDCNGDGTTLPKCR